MTISEHRKNRLDRALSDISAINPKYRACPNPRYTDVTFEMPGIPAGTHIFGVTFFDLRIRYTESLARRGFVMKCDNQGAMPINMSVCDSIPEDCPDGEIIGIDTDGCLIQWNADDQETYNSGEKPKQFGLANFQSHELLRVELGLV